MNSGIQIYLTHCCKKAFFLLCLLAFQSFADIEQPYLQQGRVDYISGAIDAFENTKLQRIHNTENYIYAIDRNSCQSGLTNLRMQCMLNYAQENCRSLTNNKAKVACRYYSDIIVVNKLSEPYFLDKNERYRIAKNAKSNEVHEAMAARLQQKYAGIATRFALYDHPDCTDDDLECRARAIDTFCLAYTNSESLSWQYCVAALVWFIGTVKE